MKYISILLLKIKNTLKYRHNLILLTALPALAAAGAWALLTFYFEGGASIPVGVLDYDNTEFSKTVISRFAENSTVGVKLFETGDVYSAAGADFADTTVANADLADTTVADADLADITAAFDGALAEISGSDMYKEASRLVRVNSIEAAVIIMPGFGKKIKAGNPEGIFHIICTPAGVSRGLVAELFAAQVSRLYFNCDSANRVVSDAETAARNAKNPPLTETEKADLFDMAFAYCDSYWEPEPLMSVEYERFEASRAPDSAAAANSGLTADKRSITSVLETAGGWYDVREMLNDLLARAVFAIFFVYAVFCIINATGVMITERAAGVLTRMRAGGYGAAAWISVSAAAPFILYGVPGAAIMAFLKGRAGGAAFPLIAFMCAAALGSWAAYVIKKPGVYKIFMLISVIVSAGAAIIAL